MKRKNYTKKEFMDKVQERLEKKRYQTNPFLHTRVKQRLKDRPSSDKQWVWSPQLAWKMSAACLLIAVNLITFFRVQSVNGEANVVNALSQEYSWTESEADNIYYLNLD